MSRRSMCEIKGCTNEARKVGLCSTHERDYYERGGVEAGLAVERREARRRQEAKVDWEYLDDEQRYAIERGVKDAYYENGTLQPRDLENMLQEAWIWAATHKAEVEKIETLTLLRERARSRSVEGHRTGWTNEQQVDYWEDLLPSHEED